MKKNAILLLAAVFIMLASCQEPEKKVLLIYSYHAGFNWVEEEGAGVAEAMEGESYIMENFYMDTKRNTSEDYMTEITAKALQKIEEMSPDLVMLFDDNATRLVGAALAGREIPVVFCGVNGDPSTYWDKAPNITGLLEREYAWQALDAARLLVPTIESAAIFLDDSPTSNSMLQSMMDGPETPDIKHIIKTNDYALWQKEILAIQDSVDAIGIFAYFTLKDSLGNTIESTEALRWTLENNKLPEWAILDITIYDGALCGAVETGINQGRTAALIAKRILNGEMPYDIPYESHETGILYINKNRAAALGITIPDGLGDEVRFVE